MTPETALKTEECAKNAPLRTFEAAHTEIIYSVQLSLNGKEMYSASEDRTIKVWDLVEDRILHVFENAHNDTIWSLALDNTGKLLISGAEDRTVKVWDIAQRQLLYTLPNAEMNVAFNGKYLANASDTNIKIWNLEKQALLHTFEQAHASWIRVVVFGKQSDLLISCSYDHTIKAWNLHRKQCIRTIFNAHMKDINTIALCEKKGLMVSGADDLSLRIWSMKTQKLISYFDNAHTEWISSVAILNTEPYIISASADKSIKVWNYRKHVQIKAYTQAHTGVIQCLAVSPDEQFVASASSDKVIKLWDCCFVSGTIEGKKHELRMLLHKGHSVAKILSGVLLEQRKTFQSGFKLLESYFKKRQAHTSDFRKEDILSDALILAKIRTIYISKLEEVIQAENDDAFENMPLLEFVNRNCPEKELISKQTRLSSEVSNIQKIILQISKDLGSQLTLFGEQENFNEQSFTDLNAELVNRSHWLQFKFDSYKKEQENLELVSLLREIYEKAEDTNLKRNSCTWRLTDSLALLKKYTAEFEKSLEKRHSICKDMEKCQGSLYAAKETIKIPKLTQKYEEIQGYAMKNIKKVGEIQLEFVVMQKGSGHLEKTIDTLQKEKECQDNLMSTFVAMIYDAEQELVNNLEAFCKYKITSLQLYHYIVELLEGELSKTALLRSIKTHVFIFESTLKDLQNLHLTPRSLFLES